MTLIGATITVAVVSLLTVLFVFALMLAELGAAEQLAESYGLTEGRDGRAGGGGRSRHGLVHRGLGPVAREMLGEEERTP